MLPSLSKQPGKNQHDTTATLRRTFDMRGGRQLAKPDIARPLDGRVRRHRDLGVCETEIAKMRDRPSGERHDSTLVGSLYRQPRTRHQALWTAVPPA